ncbi:hypothetical protein L1887_48202 [Cichorium endivia]|nr:hypothetical protein L1887_48202 [Cichorium endivia]
MMAITRDGPKCLRMPTRSLALEWELGCSCFCFGSSSRTRQLRDWVARKAVLVVERVELSWHMQQPHRKFALSDSVGQSDKILVGAPMLSSLAHCRAVPRDVARDVPCRS